MKINEDAIPLDQTVTQTLPEDDLFYPKALNAESNPLKKIFLLHVQTYMNYLYNHAILKGIKLTLAHAPPISDS